MFTPFWRFDQRTMPARGKLAGLTWLVVSLLSGMAPPSLMAQNPQSPAELMDASIESLLELEIDSVYGASKYQQTIAEAPASITIITSEEIQKYGYQTLSDILRGVRGFYVTYDRNYSYLGFRGYGRPGDYNSRVHVLVDGHLLNDNIYGSALLGTEFPIDVDLIDRIEVIRGPNSSVYVASSFLGVINIITKRGRDEIGPAVSGQLGSLGTYQGRVSYGRRFNNNLDMLLSGTFHHSQGPDRLFFQEFADPATNNGIARDVDDDQFQQLFANVSYGRFTLHGVYGSREKGIPTASFGTVFNDPRSRTTDSRGYLDLQYQRDLSNGLVFLSRAYFDLYDYEGTYVYEPSDPDGLSPVLLKDFANGNSWGGEVTLSKAVSESHRVTVGAEYRDNFRQDQVAFDTQPFYEYLNDRRSSDNWGLYAQDEIHLGSKVVLNLGLRFDRYSTFGGATNPRAALIYNPRDRTTIKLLYGQAFRPPNFYELYYQAPGNESNPSLRPETVKTTELIWEQYFTNRFRFTVSAFHYPIRGLISAQSGVAPDSIIYANVDRIDIRGMDLALRRRFPFGLEGGIGYSFQDAKNQDSANPLTNSPKHVGQANLSVPLIRQKLFASVDLQSISRRRTFSGTHTPAYVISNVTLYSPKMIEGWEISASIYNLFNRKYSDPAGEEHLQDQIVQDGRRFRLKVGRRF